MRGSKKGRKVKNAKWRVKPVFYVLAIAAIALIVFAVLLIPSAREIFFVYMSFYGIGIAGILSGILITYFILRFWKKGEGKNVWHFTSWKFWALAIVGLAFLFALYVGSRGASNLFFTFLMILLNAGMGLEYYSSKVFPASKDYGTLFSIIWFLYWPFLFSMIGLILSKRLSRRVVVFLSIFVLLMLFLGFSGCAQEIIESSKGPW